METVDGSPRRALPTGRRGRHASQGGADVPKRPALSPRKAGVSMVGSPGSPPFCAGTLSEEPLGHGFEAGF